MKLTLLDETFAGKTLNHLLVEVDKDSCTLQELIAKRVEAEVEKFNEQQSVYFQGLVQPTSSEATLNGYRLRKSQQIDPEQQVFTALHAYTRNAFFVLVDDEQVTDLEEVIDLQSERKISFIKLTPLVGG
ncbi:MAG: hypothetical protein AAGI38_05685 [Bacteroidota bacterium]